MVNRRANEAIIQLGLGLMAFNVMQQAKGVTGHQALLCVTEAIDTFDLDTVYIRAENIVIITNRACNIAAEKYGK